MMVVYGSNVENENHTLHSIYSLNFIGNSFLERFLINNLNSNKCCVLFVLIAASHLLLCKVKSRLPF